MKKNSRDIYNVPLFLVFRFPLQDFSVNAFLLKFNRQ
jgi:hypothetical protein